MGRFKKRTVKRWRDTWKLFEAVSAQRHSRDAFAFISNVLSRSAELFPEEDSRTKWDKYCVELMALNSEIDTKFLDEETPVAALRHLFRTVEHAGYRMYQLLHSIESDEKREAAIVQWESRMAVAFRMLVYAVVAHWCPDRQEYKMITVNLGNAHANPNAVSIKHYPMDTNKAHRKYGSYPR